MSLHISRRMRKKWYMKEIFRKREGGYMRESCVADQSYDGKKWFEEG